jgi:hypothetical protein
MILLALPLACLAAGLSFLWLGLLKGRWLPEWPAPGRLTANMPPLTIRTAGHWLVNVMVEAVRADPQWWSKCLCFLVIVAAIF